MNLIKKSLEDSYFEDQAKEDVRKEKEEERIILEEEKYFKEVKDAVKRVENLRKQGIMKKELLNENVPIKALYGHGSKDIPINLEYTNNDTGINVVTTTKWGSSQSIYNSLFLSYGLMTREVQSHLKRTVAELVDRSILEEIW